MLVQFLKPKLDAYDRAVLARKAKHGYRPFHERCWDFPTWAIPLVNQGQSLRLLDGPIDVGDQTVYGSVMDCNRTQWVSLVGQNPQAYFRLGGYTKPLVAPNVRWHESIDEVVDGTRWPAKLPFNGYRLQMSTGCNNYCSFCTVEYGTTAVDWQRDLPEGPFGIVYIDDKTFGQCENWHEIYLAQQLLQCDGFVIQTTPTQALKLPWDKLRNWGVIACELGVESYNDGILHRCRKPASRYSISEAADRIAAADVLVCPNILVGLDGETEATYANTQRWLERCPNLGWINLYHVVDYRNGGDETVHDHPLLDTAIQLMSSKTSERPIDQDSLVRFERSGFGPYRSRYGYF